MANTINFILTNAALELIPKILNGKTLNFTRMAVGDGFSYDDTIAKGFETLVNEVLSVDITKKEVLTTSSVRITSAFSSSDAQKEFYYREVGLFAQDPDTGREILYAYGNRNEAAELITPIGKNIVTKKLIFIVSVGDSANVTFNVNEDVYALQSDMLEVQENLRQFETGKANKNLSNTGMITNCLLEVPQKIKLELNDGVLILKADSKVCFPNGFEADGVTKRFDEVIVDEDISLAESTGIPNGKQGLFYIDIDKGIHYYDLSIIFSGSVAPTSETYALWYDTTNNKIYETRDGGITWIKQGCLPICLFRSNGRNISAIDQIFNGMGFIGSHAWIDKGVKGLIPNGRNPDGTLNNIETKTNEIMFVGVGYGTGIVNIAFNSSTLGLNDYYLDEMNNIVRVITDDEVRDLCIIGKLGVTSGVITSLKLDTLFQTINKSSDKPWLSSLAMPSEKYIELELGERGSTYNAPANGYFAIRKVAGIVNANFTLAVWNSTGSDEICRTTMYAPTEITEIAFSVPVSKGQTVAVDYDATGETIYFRFIYAQGELN